MDPILAIIVGLIGGAAIAAIVMFVLLRRRTAADLARKLLEEADERRHSEAQAMLEQARATFGELSQTALIRNNEQFLQLAQDKLASQSKQHDAALDARKQLIDETVKQIGGKLIEVNNLLQTFDKDRRQDQGKLLQQLETTTRTTAELQHTAAQLRAALANPQRRGQWGERMAEDVLRLVGMIEGINYEKQSTVAGGTRPDFTFPLPEDRRVNMDVKFPLANYLAFLDAREDADRERARTAFIRDVRQRIREVTTRDYIDPEAGTVDYVLVFIPNEQVYGFIHESEPGLLDDALESKVVLCSPLTLYAMLAVVRQVAENARIEQASREILALLSTFNKEWRKYTEQMEKMGRSLASAVDHYERLTTTRSRKLEKQLDRIEDLRTQREIALPDEEPAALPPNAD